jgi:hypothetical protein
MGLVSCRECLNRVAVDAATCPRCGVSSPGEDGEQRDAARQADADTFEKRLWLGCGGFVLLIALLVGGGAAWNASTATELDNAAEEACAAVDRVDFSSTNLTRLTARAAAVNAAMRSESDGLAAAAGIGPALSEDLFARYDAVDAWCEENADN